MDSQGSSFGALAGYSGLFDPFQGAACKNLCGPGPKNKGKNRLSFAGKGPGFHTGQFTLDISPMGMVGLEELLWRGISGGPAAT
jgi:hypothetical protein